MLQIETIERLPGRLLVSHYLIASFNYYHLDQSPMTDQAFDRLCVRLLEQYDSIEHTHKHLISKDDLAAGSCFLPYEKFPSRVLNTAYDYYNHCISGRMVALLEEHLCPIINTSTQATSKRISRTRSAVAETKTETKRITRSRRI